MGRRLSAPPPRRLRLRRVGRGEAHAVLRSGPRRRAAVLLRRDAARVRLRQRHRSRARRPGRRPRARRIHGGDVADEEGRGAPRHKHVLPGRAQAAAGAWPRGHERRGAAATLLAAGGRAAGGAGPRRRLRRGVSGPVFAGGEGPPVRPRPDRRPSERWPGLVERRGPRRPRIAAPGPSAAACLHLAAAIGRRAAGGRAVGGSTMPSARWPGRRGCMCSSSLQPRRTPSPCCGATAPFHKRTLVPTKRQCSAQPPRTGVRVLLSGLGATRASPSTATDITPACCWVDVGPRCSPRRAPAGAIRSGWRPAPR